MDTSRVKIVGGNIEEILKEVDGDLKFQPADNIYVYYAEKYYMRNNAELMSSFIIKLEDANSCTVDLIAGGGAVGIFGITLGAEAQRVEELIEYFEKICREKGWRLEIK